MEDIIDSTGYCSVHKSYHCECYKSPKVPTTKLYPKSERGQDWCTFAGLVLAHIEGYTIPQYGDKGCDQCTEFDEQDFITNLKRYLNRHGKNSRPGQNKLDKIKMAHYIQMLHDLIEE